MTEKKATQTLKVDFVSDVVCPWCAIGLSAFELAAARVANDAIEVRLYFQPFQLNPDMPAVGQDITEHLQQKYGSSAQEQARTYAMIQARGAQVGFEFKEGGRGRTWNTFDCHRLLYWAGELGLDANGVSWQLRLKKEFLKTHFTLGHNPSDPAQMLAIVDNLGLDAARATAILQSDAYTAQVRARQHFYAQQGIQSVPAVIINDRHLVSGGQPVAAFEQALRQVAALSDAAPQDKS